MLDVSVPAVEMRGIVKRFPGVLANDHVDLTVEQGRSMPCWERTAPARPP
jgi:nucleoside ABC transporter ATP-binding protein